MSEDASVQRIARLTPLDAVLARIAAQVGAVPPRKVPVAAARGATLAEDVVAAARPSQPIALRDGFAVPAAAVADAGPYAPVRLPLAACRIDVGQPLPRGVDAVLPPDAVALHGDRAEAVAAAAAGEGVLAAGGDATPQWPLRRAGERLRALDIAAIGAAGVAEVAIRAPRLSTVRGGTAGSPLLDAALAWLTRAAAEAGAAATATAVPLDAALTDADDDAVIAVGGTGSGRRDSSVQTLARLGRLETHGIAVSPGETAAFGFVGPRPVLLIPGRFDAVLAVWLLLGRHLVARLAGGGVADIPQLMPLRRKVASPLGLTELIPVSCAGSLAEPLASGYLSLTALARSDGWIAVPPDSEGFAAGTQVAVQPWP